MAMQKFMYQNQVVIVYKGIPYFDGSGYVEIFEPQSGNTKMVQISELTPIPNVTVVLTNKETSKENKSTPKKKETKTKKKEVKKVEKKKVKKESIEGRLESFLNEYEYPDEKRGLSRFSEYKKLHPYKQSQELKDNPTLNNATKIAKDLVDKDKKKMIKGVQADHLKFRKDNVYKESIEYKLQSFLDERKRPKIFLKILKKVDSMNG